MVTDQESGLPREHTVSHDKNKEVKTMAKTVRIVLTSMGCLFLCVGIAWGEGNKNLRRQIMEASSADQLTAIYQGTENAMVRRDALQALSRIHGPQKQGLGKKAAATGPQEEEKILRLLDRGLEDPDVSVVKEAIRQTGKLRLEAYRETLFDLFHAAGEKFPGNQKEIRMEIIEAFGELDGREGESLFREILGKGVANSMTTRVLLILQSTGDSSMVDAVAAYGNSLEASLQGIPETPENLPRYHKYRQALALARSVEKTLAQR